MQAMGDGLGMTEAQHGFHPPVSEPCKQQMTEA